ncbi:hypothetical protein E2562_003354 [Oryza meyeriana var. granulata]|uniref:CCHC-type domain-containing protein n=1 Tax=Oryza meyeriana var. granulata TaxID=110450 RepID=A0A6G1EEE1_9ORYZ|nr:hypothetical protein E2562_003354 [Oryza meyeriana var. granulata]
MGDVMEMSVMETIGRLRAFEESSKGRRCAKEEKRSSEGSGSSGEKKKYRGKFDKLKIDCRNCGEFGHFADECPAMKKVVKGMVQLAMVDADDEPALL